MIKHTEELKQEALRISLTSGFPRGRVALDLGTGKSTLGKWVSQYRPRDLISAPQADSARENECPRLENRTLREAREILKGHAVLREPKTAKLAFVLSWPHRWPVKLLCLMMLVSERGYRAWRSRSISRRERADTKLQAHGLRPSISGKGDCYDNASAMTFFKSLKAELIWWRSWPTRRRAEAAIFQYINGFYNARRRHSYLGGISPLAFKAKVA